MTPAIEPGAVFTVKYPFLLTCGSNLQGDGPCAFPSWRPGTEQRQTYDDYETIYHGVGAMVLTVVDTFKPQGFPTRVFYTRKWIDPQGREFGKSRLRITTLGAFNRMKAGHRYRNTAKRDGVQEAAEALARSLNMTTEALWKAMGLDAPTKPQEPE